jgi:Mor family transcriptional regulator
MPSSTNEAGIILAMEAFKRREGASIASMAKVYNVSQKTLARRLRGTPARRDTTPKSKKLTATEEKVIVDFILDLDARAFPPRLSGVEDMANQLLEARGAERVGKCWAMNFVKRQPQLKTRYTRRFDYQRAQ